MERYDIGQVKSLAIGRWIELLNVDPEFLDTKHHPCPKQCSPDAGGRDRFRALDDFYSSGAVVCNKCFNSRNGDGLATYAWFNNCSFSEALEAVATKLGIAPNKVSQGKGNGKASSKKANEKPRKSLDELFSIQPWNESLANIFCVRKGGIVASSLVAVGAVITKHFDSIVMSLPIRNAAAEIIGYTSANVSGGKLIIPGESPEAQSEVVSWKNSIPTKTKGIIATANLFDPALRSSITRIYKTEGPSDLLAIIPFLQPGEGAFCNPSGAGENPLNFAWLLDWLAGKQVVVIHDRDKAGVDGALGNTSKSKQGWAPWAAERAAEVRNVDLPFPLVESHGKDFRDWVSGGGTADGFKSLINSAKVIKKAGSFFVEDDDDPHRLARVNLENYQVKHGRKLVYWRDEWYRWKDGKYAKIELTELRAKVSNAIRSEFEQLWPGKLQKYLNWKSSDQYSEFRDKGPPSVQKVTRNLVSNVIGAMEGMCAISGTIEMPSWIPDRSRPHYVAMGNGILDLELVCDGKPMEEFLLPHSPNWFSTFQLRYNYSKDAGCPKWLAYLEFVMGGDRDRIAILQEWAGYLLTSANDHQKFMAFEGEGQNGKTVYFAAIRAMLGEENVSSVALENFDGRFDLADTLGKAANISADVGDIDFVAEGMLKQFTGGDTMQFDRKNRQPISARPTAKLMLSWNKRPRFRDRSKGLWRRMILVPFQVPITAEKRVMGMDNPQWWIDSGEAPGILRWAIVGLDRLKTNRAFTSSDICNQMIEDYQQDTNPAKEFLMDHCEFIDNEDYVIECTWLYKLYSMWCIANGNRPLANNSFGKEIVKIFPGVIRCRQFYAVDNSRPWVYKKLKFTVDKICEKFVCEISY